MPDRLSHLSHEQRKNIERTLLFLGRGATVLELAGRRHGPGEGTLEKCARALVHSGKGVTLRQLLGLSPAHLSAISRLLDTLALGPDAVEWWLDDYAPPGLIRHRSSRAASG